MTEEKMEDLKKEKKDCLQEIKFVEEAIPKKEQEVRIVNTQLKSLKEERDMYYKHLKDIKEKMKQ